jgi:hypothetical protein
MISHCRETWKFALVSHKEGRRILQSACDPHPTRRLRRALGQTLTTVSGLTRPSPHVRSQPLLCLEPLYLEELPAHLGNSFSHSVNLSLGRTFEEHSQREFTDLKHTQLVPDNALCFDPIVKHSGVCAGLLPDSVISQIARRKYRACRTQRVSNSSDPWRT